jgi:excisionase family DNA binding protein
MRQAGAYLAVSYWTVRTWVESGRLKAVRLPGGGKLLRIERAALDALIESCRDD